MNLTLSGWLVWAVLSAVFAALTAIFGKIGVAAIDSNLATLIRTVIILVIVALIVAGTETWQPLGTIPAKTWAFLALSGAATGLSWLCYYRALKLGPASAVAPVDKLSVVLVSIFGALVLGESLTLTNWIGVAMIAAGAILVGLKL